jgi:hypothetical protein
MKSITYEAPYVMLFILQTFSSALFPRTLSIMLFPHSESSNLIWF